MLKSYVRSAAILLLLIAGLGQTQAARLGPHGAGPASGGGGQSFVNVGLSASTFTNGTGPGVTVATILVTLSPASPPFTGAGGGVALTGTNAADFQVTNSGGSWLLQTNSGAGTLPSNTTFSLNLVPTQTGVSGSSAYPVMISSAAGSAYVGPCDVITGGCGEAWNMANAMTNTYSGPLFQVALYSSPTTTMDVPQTSGHLVDMTGVQTFCGGTYSNCAISKIYANIHGHQNDALANFRSGGPSNQPANCGNINGNGPLDCACPLTIDPNSGTPYAPLSTAGRECQYILMNAPTGVDGDGYAVGMTGGTSPLTEFVIGRSPPTGYQDLNCGAISLGHCSDCGDTPGALLSTGITWGLSGDYVSCPQVSGVNGYCQAWDVEGGNTQTVSLGTSQLYGVVMFQWDNGANVLNGFTNGHQMFASPITPPATMNFGSAGITVHLGGGGDLCVDTVSFNMFGAMIMNSVVSSSDYNAVLGERQSRLPEPDLPMSEITRRRLLGSAAAIAAMQAWAEAAWPLGHLGGAGGTGGGSSPEIVLLNLSPTTYLDNTPNAVVGDVTVTLSSGTFTGTLAISGTNSGGLHLSSSTLPCQLLTNGSGTTSGALNDFTITATQAGLSNSPQSISPPISGYTPGANVVNLVNDDLSNPTVAGVPSRLFGWVFAPGQIPNGHAPAFKTSGGVAQPFSASPVNARSYHADGSLAYCAFAIRPTLSVAPGGTEPLTISDSGSTTWPAQTRDPITELYPNELCVFAPHCTVGGVSTYGQDPTTDWGAWLSDQNNQVNNFTGSISTSGVLTVSGSVTGTPISVGQGVSTSGLPENTIIVSGSGTTWQLSQSPASPIGPATIVTSNIVFIRHWLTGDAGEYFGFTVNMSQTPGGAVHGLLATDFYVHMLTYAPGGIGTPVLGGFRFWADIRQPYFDINASPAGASPVKQMRVFAPPNPASPTSGLYWGENSNAHAPGNWVFPTAGTPFTASLAPNFTFPGYMTAETFTVQGYFTGGQFIVTSAPSNNIPVGVPLTTAGLPSGTSITGYGSFNGTNTGYSFVNYAGTIGSSGSPVTVTGSYSTLNIVSLSGSGVNTGDYITGTGVASDTIVVSHGGEDAGGGTAWVIPGGQTVGSSGSPETLTDNGINLAWNSVPSYVQPPTVPMIPVGDGLPTGMQFTYFGLTYVKANPFSGNGAQAANFGTSFLPSHSQNAQFTVSSPGSGNMVAVPVVMPGQKFSIGDQWGEYQFFQGNGSISGADVPLRSGIVNQQQWNNSTIMPPYDLSQTGMAVGGQVSGAFQYLSTNQYNPYSWGELSGNLGAGSTGPYMSPWPNSCSNEFYNGDLTSYRDCIHMALGAGLLTGADMAYSGFPTMPPMKMGAGASIGQASYAGMGPSVPSFYGNVNGGEAWSWPSPYVIPDDTGNNLGPLALDDFSQHWAQPVLYAYIRTGRLELFDRVIQQATMSTTYNSIWAPCTIIPGKTYYNIALRASGKIAVRYSASVVKTMCCALWAAPKDPSGMWNPSGIDFAGSQMYQYYYDAVRSNFDYMNKTVDPTYTPALFPSPPNDPNTANLVATDKFFTALNTEDTFTFLGYISAPGSPGTPGTTLKITGITSSGATQPTVAPASGMVLLASGQQIGGAAAGTAIVTGSHVWTDTYQVNISQAVGSPDSPATFTWNPLCYGGSVVFEEGLFALGANFAYATTGMPEAQTFLENLGTYYNSWTKRGGMYNAYAYGFIMGPLTPISFPDGTTGSSQAVWGSEDDGWYYSGIDVWFEDGDNAFIQPNSAITPSPTQRAFSITGSMDQQGIHTQMQNGDYVCWPSNYKTNFGTGLPIYINVGVVYTVVDASGNSFNLKDPSGTYLVPTDSTAFQNNVNWRSGSNFPLGAAAFGSDFNNYTGLVNCFMGWAWALGIDTADVQAVYNDANTRIAAHGTKFGGLGGQTYSQWAMNNSFT